MSVTKEDIFEFIKNWRDRKNISFDYKLTVDEIILFVGELEELIAEMNYSKIKNTGVTIVGYSGSGNKVPCWRTVEYVAKEINDSDAIYISMLPAGELLNNPDRDEEEIDAYIKHYNELKAKSEAFEEKESVLSNVNDDKNVGAKNDSFGGAPDAANTNKDPLILDLNHNKKFTCSQEEGVYFDFDGDGFAEKTSWIDQGDGLLVYDRNNNGIIDDGKELFGDKTVMSNGKVASNGFEALSDLDTKHPCLVN